MAVGIGLLRHDLRYGRLSVQYFDINMSRCEDSLIISANSSSGVVHHETITHHRQSVFPKGHALLSALTDIATSWSLLFN